MCLLIVSPPGTTPRPDRLWTSTTTNPDGFGWAIVADGRIVSHRTLDATDAVVSFCEARERHPDGPALFHARLATHGTVSVPNCHPFPVAGDDDIVVAHNGVLPCTPPPGRDWSDTRTFAERVLPGLGLDTLDTARGVAALGRWASGSKLCVLSVSPLLRSSFYIVNEHDGFWDDADLCWYSNGSGHVWDRRDRLVSSDGTWDDTDDDWDDTGDTCVNCGDACAEWCRTECDDDDCEIWSARMCHTCGSCLDCDAPCGECDCYTLTR